MNDKNAHTPLVLMILDGWGHREETEFNAIRLGDTPCWDEMWRDDPHTLIETSGETVGLPAGQMGNSEVGHMTLGSGCIVRQDLVLIDDAIADRSFFDNAVLIAAAPVAVVSASAAASASPRPRKTTATCAPKNSATFSPMVGRNSRLARLGANGL